MVSVLVVHSWNFDLVARDAIALRYRTRFTGRVAAFAFEIVEANLPNDVRMDVVTHGAGDSPIVGAIATAARQAEELMPDIWQTARSVRGDLGPTRVALGAHGGEITFGDGSRVSRRAVVTALASNPWSYGHPAGCGPGRNGGARLTAVNYSQANALHSLRRASSCHFFGYPFRSSYPAGHAGIGWTAGHNRICGVDLLPVEHGLIFAKRP
jgi:hypothetical protein